MATQNHANPIDRKRFLRKEGHLTRPPRLEGVVKEKMMKAVKKKPNV